jgi:hypothetical protein
MKRTTLPFYTRSSSSSIGLRRLLLVVVMMAVMGFAGVALADCSGTPEAECASYNESAGMCESVSVCDWANATAQCVRDPRGCDAFDADDDACKRAPGCAWHGALNNYEIVGIILAGLVVLVVVLLFTKAFIDHRRRAKLTRFTPIDTSALVAGAAYTPPTFPSGTATL